MSNDGYSFNFDEQLLSANIGLQIDGWKLWTVLSDDCLSVFQLFAVLQIDSDQAEWTISNQHMDVF